MEPRVDNPRFGEALAQQVVWMAKESHQVAALRLDPPDLGPLQVTLTINNDQATAAFFSSHESVRDAVEASAPRLREMLAEAGLTLTGFSVATQAQQGGREYGGNRRRSADAADLAQELPLPPGGVNPLRGGRGLVDTFA